MKNPLTAADFELVAVPADVLAERPDATCGMEAHGKLCRRPATHCARSRSAGMATWLCTDHVAMVETFRLRHLAKGMN